MRLFAAVQLFLPRAGLFGSWLEGFKAIALYFSGHQVVMPLVRRAGGRPCSRCLVTVLSFLVSKRGVGFLPMALMAVLVLFGLWSLGKAAYLWYIAPALVAILLQMSTEAHERINLLHVLPMALGVVLLSLVLLPAGQGDDRLHGKGGQRSKADDHRLPVLYRAQKRVYHRQLRLLPDGLRAAWRRGGTQRVTP